jgi:hypothetical protein
MRSLACELKGSVQHLLIARMIRVDK